jgi:methyltransferase-like protein/cyclopropane fatty-acyl-phospholipid synthase-like methyltransferase
MSTINAASPIGPQLKSAPVSSDYSYDQVPYPNDPFPQTHPNRIATLATLFGMTPAPVENCRVLEMGTGRGANLLGMASSLPNSKFVGVELSKRQNDEAIANAAAAGASNIEYKNMSISDIDDSFGEFDYIIAHGVFSWVPREVQEKMFEVCGKHLKPQGIAYISYNTYPGWHMRGMIRDMMNIHSGPFKDPVQRIQQARALLDFLVKQCRQENTPYGMFLKQELDLLSKQSDNYLFHDHLEENNHPMYFTDFVKMFLPKNLRYLGEADFCVMLPSQFSPEAQQTLRNIAPEQVQLEQYMDFLRNRMFRQSLLIRPDVRPNYTLQPDVMKKFRVSSPLRPEKEKFEDVDLAAGVNEAFKAGDGRTLTSSDPVVKAAFIILAEEFPRSVPFEELCKRARQKINKGEEVTAEQTNEDQLNLGKAILSAYATAFTAVVELHVWSPTFAMSVSEKPTASRLARHLATVGNRVTNAFHQSVTLSDFDRQLMQYLNGENDVKQLVDQMTDLVGRGVLNMQIDQKPVTDKMMIRKAMAPTIEQQLPKLARAALLSA